MSHLAQFVILASAGPCACYEIIVENLVPPLLLRVG